jgi:hypothetical protein
MGFKLSAFDNLIDILITIAKVYIFWQIVKAFGWIIGILIICALVQLFHYFMLKFFKLEKLHWKDKFFVSFKENKRQTIVTCMKFKNFKEEELKQAIIEKQLKVFRKYRSKLVYKFFDFYWEELPLESVKVGVYHKDVILNSESELTNLLQKEINLHIDIFAGVPYEYIFVKYKDSNDGTIIFKFDHVMSDGLGISFSMLAMADNYSVDVFPKTVHGKSIPFYKYIIDFIGLPLAIIEHFKLPERKNPLVTQNMEQNGVTLIANSKCYDFQEWSKLCKKLKVSFNEFIISIFLCSWKAYFKEKGIPEPTYFSTMIPIGKKGVPNTVHDIQVKNVTSMVTVVLPIVEDPIKDIGKVSTQLRKTITNVAKPLFGEMFGYLFEECAPRFLVDRGNEALSHIGDMTITNVPGPSKTLYICGCEVSEMISVINAGKIFAFIPIQTYNNKLGFSLCVDTSLGIEPHRIISLVDEKFQEVLKSENLKIN